MVTGVVARLDGRVALVTGASSGIGRATALALTEAGAALALVALPGSELNEAAQACRQCGAEVEAMGVDVSQSVEVDRAFARARSWGRSMRNTSAPSNPRDAGVKEFRAMFAAGLAS